MNISEIDASPEKRYGLPQPESNEKSASFKLTREAAERGREEFQEVIRNANLRALIRYIEDGKIDLGQLAEIPDRWKRRFRGANFRSASYTWRNPKLYLMTPKTAAAMALDELLNRLSEGQDLEIGD